MHTHFNNIEETQKTSGESVILTNRIQKLEYALMGVECLLEIGRHYFPPKLNSMCDELCKEFRVLLRETSIQQTWRR